MLGPGPGVADAGLVYDPGLRVVMAYSGLCSSCGYNNLSSAPQTLTWPGTSGRPSWQALHYS